MTLQAYESAYTQATGVYDPTLAFNIGKPNDSGTNMMLINIAKGMRDWRAAGTDGSKITGAELEERQIFDEHGWPTHIPEDIDGIISIFAWSETREVQDQRAGNYVVTWDGEGVVELAGNATVISEEPGRIVFASNGLTFRVKISETDPNGSGDYVRDLAIVKEEHEELYEAGAIFNPDFVAMVEDARLLRFMGSNSINNSDVSEWDERGRMDDASWKTTAIPVEVQVQLANETGADAWFCMPLEATEEYIRNFATYVRDNLDPDLTATIEFSNENWNYGFDHYKRMNFAAKEAWGEDAGNNLGYHYIAKLATQTALIWKEVFAEREDAPDLVTVLGTQTGNPGISNIQLNADLWQVHEPDNYVRPGDVFDHLAVTTYFGSGVISNDDHRAELLGALDMLGVDPTGAKDASWDAGFAWLADKLMDPDYTGSIPQVLDRLAAQKEIAAENGMGIVGYEGGQHVHHLFGLKGDAKTEGDMLGEFLHQFVRSAEMADLYKALWDGWAEVGDGPFMQFSAVDNSSKWGSFGLWEHLEDTVDNPRADVLMEYNAEVQSWWTEQTGDAAHLQGVTLHGADGDDLMVGTTEEDYLIGGAGDDFFITGRGVDAIHGGDGYDVLGVAGMAADYTMVEDAEGRSVLIGPDSEVTMVSIEEIVFADGTIVVDETPHHAPLEAFLVEAPQAIVSGLDVDGRADLISVDGDMVAAGSDAGILLQVAAGHTVLGEELGEAAATTYLVSVRGEKVEIDGTSVKANWASIQMNQDGAGQTVADTALEAAKALAAIFTSPAGFLGGGGGDRITGGDLDDVFHGGAGRDMIRGGGGDDRITGGADSDTLYGNDGADVFVFEEGAGIDRIADFEAADTLDLTALQLGADVDLADHASVTAAGQLALTFGDDVVLLDDLQIEDLAWIDVLV